MNRLLLTTVFAMSFASVLAHATTSAPAQQPVNCPGYQYLRVNCPVWSNVGFYVNPAVGTDGCAPNNNAQCTIVASCPSGFTKQVVLSGVDQCIGIPIQSAPSTLRQ